MYEKKLLANGRTNKEIEQKFSQIQQFQLPYLKSDERPNTNTRLIHWVLYHNQKGNSSILDSSAEMLALIAEKLDSGSARVHFSKEDLNFLAHFCLQVDFVSSSGLHLLGMFSLEPGAPVPRFSKKNYNSLYQLALAVDPLYRFARSFKKLLEERSERFTLNKADFEDLVLDALNHSLPANDEFAQLVSALARVNYSLEALCNLALDNFLGNLEENSGQKTRQDGRPNRNISAIQDLVKILRATGNIAQANTLTEACFKAFGPQHLVSRKAKQLLECYESPSTSYLKEHIDFDKDGNSPLSFYPPLQALITKPLVSPEPRSLARTLSLELSRNPSPIIATNFLWLAMEVGVASEELVATFLSYGADLDAKRLSRSPVEWACLNKPAWVPVLLKAGAAFDDKLLFLATDLPTLQCIEQAGAKLDVRDEWNNSLLHYACRRGASAMMAYLLAQGVDVDASNKAGQTAAHLAYTTEIPAYDNEQLDGCSKARDPVKFMQAHLRASYPKPINVEILGLLAEYQADLSIKDRYGLTPYDHSRASGCEKITAKFCGQRSLNPHEVFQAVMEGRKDMVAVVQQHLNEGGDVNIRQRGVGLLFQASLCGYDELAQLLLDKGALPDEQLEDQQFQRDCFYRATPLFLACDHGKNNIISLLLKKGADINRPCSNNLTPFFAACEKSNKKAIWLMIDLAYEQLMQVTAQQTGQYRVTWFTLIPTKTADELSSQALKLLLNMQEEAQGVDEPRLKKLADVIEHLRDLRKETTKALEAS